MLSIRRAIRTYWCVVVMVLFTAITLINFNLAVAQQPAPTTVPIVDDTLRAAEATTDMMVNFFDRLTQVPQSAFVRAVMILVGVILLVAGWRVYEFVIVIAGAMVGAAVATSLVGSSDPVTNLLALLGGGAIGAVLSMFLYYLAVFLIGMHFGILLTNGLATMFAFAPVSPLILIIGGVLGGLVLVGLSFEFLVILSALVGGQLLVLGLGIPTIWTLVFAVIGIVVQFALTQTYHYEFRRRAQTCHRSWARN